MTQQEVDRAEQIAADLADLPQEEALEELSRAQLLLMGEGAAASRFNPLLKRKPRDELLISRNPEVGAFLNGLTRHYTLDELMSLLRERFGKRKGLNRSSLARYIRRRTKEAEARQEDGKCRK